MCAKNSEIICNAKNRIDGKLIGITMNEEFIIVIAVERAKQEMVNRKVRMVDVPTNTGWTDVATL